MLFARCASVLATAYLAATATANFNGHLISSISIGRGRTAQKVQCGLNNFFPNISPSDCAPYIVDTTYFDLDVNSVNRLKNCDLSVGGSVVIASNVYISGGNCWVIAGGLFSWGINLLGQISVGILNLIGSVFAGINVGIGHGGHNGGGCDNSCKCKFALNYSQLLFPTIDVYQAAQGNCADKVIYAKWQVAYHGIVKLCGATL